MKINSDFKDLLRSLNAAGVRYLIVGGYAVMVHTEPRYTKDLYIWIDPELENARAMLEAIANFGAPTSDVKPSILRTSWPPKLPPAVSAIRKTSKRLRRT